MASVAGRECIRSSQSAHRYLLQTAVFCALIAPSSTVARQELLWILVELRLASGATEIHVLALVFRMGSRRGDGKCFTGDRATGFGAHFLGGVKHAVATFSVSVMAIVGTAQRLRHVRRTD